MVQSFSPLLNVSSDEWLCSDIVSTRTLDSIPKDAPHNFRVTATGTDKISVAWDPPRRPNGLLLGYKCVSSMSIFYFACRSACSLESQAKRPCAARCCLLLFCFSFSLKSNRGV
jgi:hypothetical protein